MQLVDALFVAGVELFKGHRYLARGSIVDPHWFSKRFFEKIKRLASFLDFFMSLQHYAVNCIQILGTGFAELF